MYEVLKSIANKLFPGLLKSQEESLRKVLAWKYRGDRYQCNICDTHLSTFIHRKNGDQLCPRCGSVGRTRKLLSLIPVHTAPLRVLHFSPPKAMKKRLQTFSNYLYKTTDFEGEFEADYQYDISNIDSPSHQFDMIICYHVLEHVVEDIKAMSELYRILDQNGFVYIQTPYTDGNLIEDYSISTREDRLTHYGQADHVRIYTVAVLAQRLQSVGFEVEIIENKEEPENYHGYKMHEHIIVARKP